MMTCSIAMMKSLDLSHHYQTSINGIVMSFPKSLLFINDGDYIVNVDDHNVIVKLQRENSKIETSIIIPSELSSNAEYKHLPIACLVNEIIKSYAAKQSILVNDIEKVHMYIYISIFIYM